MSQVVSIRVSEYYKEACAAFQKEIDLADQGGTNRAVGRKFMIFYDESSCEIRCEGDYPDSFVSALIKVKDKFGGKLFYEGEEWNEKEDEVLSKAKPLEKILVLLAIIFFPVTMVYVLLRLIVWVPYKFWRATK